MPTKMKSTMGATVNPMRRKRKARKAVDAAKAQANPYTDAKGYERKLTCTACGRVVRIPCIAHDGNVPADLTGTCICGLCDK